MTPRLAIVVAAGIFFSGGVSKDCPQPTRQDSPQPAKDDKDWKFARHLASAIQLIADNHVTKTTDAKMVHWAVEGLYKELKKPIPMEIAERLAKLEKANKEDLLLLLHDVRTDLGQRKDLEDDKDLELCLQAIFLELEAGARPEDRSCLFRQEFRCILRSFEPVGIGLKVEADLDSGMLRVITPILNGPAYKAGIRGGDLITQIQLHTDGRGEPLDKPKVVSTKCMSAEEAKGLFLGKKGTRVTLTVVPAKPAQERKDE